MMQAIHSQRILPKVPKAGCRRQRHTVYRRVVGRRLVVVCRGVLSGQVLSQCTAKMDI